MTDTLSLPDFIKFSSSDPKVFIFTNSNDDVGVYYIRASVQLDDITKSSLSFDFKVEVLALPEIDVAEFSTNNAPYFEVTP